MGLNGNAPRDELAIFYGGFLPVDRSSQQNLPENDKLSAHL